MIKSKWSVHTKYVKKEQKVNGYTFMRKEKTNIVKPKLKNA